MSISQKRRSIGMELSSPRGAGFTLVEILVAVVIVAVLVAIALPSLRGARSTARASACASNLRQFAAGANAYAVEQRRLPASASGSPVEVMEIAASFWECPANMGTSEGLRSVSYLYPAAPLAMRGSLPPGHPRIWELYTRMYEDSPRLPLAQDRMAFHSVHGGVTESSRSTSDFRNVVGYDGAVTREFDHNLQVVGVPIGR